MTPLDYAPLLGRVVEIRDGAGLLIGGECINVIRGSGGHSVVAYLLGADKEFRRVEITAMEQVEAIGVVQP